MAWANARRSGVKNDWLRFRKLRHRFTSQLRKAKAEFDLSETTNNLNDPQKFWQTIRSLSTSAKPTGLPLSLVKNGVTISDKVEMLNCFNEHFISSGLLFDSAVPMGVEPVFDDSTVFDNSFIFSPFAITNVHKALKELNPRKAASPDHLEPFFLKLKADFIAEPITHIFNLLLVTNIVPKVWKSAYVLPLFKGGDPSVTNNYRPISLSS